MAGQGPGEFGPLLRRLRIAAALTQEELAAAAGVSTRSVSDLERGVNLTARKDTARLLADALRLDGAAKSEFVQAARGYRLRGSDGGLGGVAAGGLVVATRTLPRDIPSFMGREPELEGLFDAVRVPYLAGAVGIHAIGGMAGIGKTAFAVHAAHQLAPQFPDGQIFLSLHGHTPGHQPVDAVDALGSLLLTTGVAPQQIPPGLEARMALWRDRLARRQLLLVLDDASDSEQVRPLLPGAGGSLVLVTSRRHLSALEDATTISLDTLSPEHAARLLVRLAARPGLNPDDEAVSEIARLCGYLPLGIGMLARQLHHHPTWTPADLATDLAAARDRLDLMSTENVSVAAAINLSYEDLNPSQKQIFRRLGLHLGNDIDAYAAAALDGATLYATQRNLAALYDHYLLSEPARGRYRLHDLVREHARVLAAEEPAADNDAALDRELRYYLHAARSAVRHLPRRVPNSRPTPAEDSSPPQIRQIPNVKDAVAWLDAERLNLHAAVVYAAAFDRTGYAIAIPTAIQGFLRVRGHWDQARILYQNAAEAARRSGDGNAEADVLADLGDIASATGDYTAARANYERSLELSISLDNPLGEAGALHHLATIEYLTGDFSSAMMRFARALQLYRKLGSQQGEANALREMGSVHRQEGNFREANTSLSQALALDRDVDPVSEANDLTQLGAVQEATGDYQAAIASFTRALNLCGAVGNRLGQANALNRLGIAYYYRGDFPNAAASQERALELYRDLGSGLGEANSLNCLGTVQRAAGNYDQAAASLAAALRLCRDLRYPSGEAWALNHLGMVQQATGDFLAAAGSQEHALTLYRELGDQQGEAEALNAMGELALARNASALEARNYFAQALELAVSIAVVVEQARALEGIGRVYLRGGESGNAAAPLHQALDIYRRIGSPAAERIMTDLGKHGL